MFTQQHYKAIASILRANRHVCANTMCSDGVVISSIGRKRNCTLCHGRGHRDSVIDGIVNDLCTMFQQDNPNFNRDTFIIDAFSPPTQHDKFVSNYHA